MMQIDANGIPFICLPDPHSNIIITPPRPDDGTVVVPMMNDRRVYMNLANPPYPYAQKDWEGLFSRIQKATGDALAEWKEIEKYRTEASEDNKDKEKRWMGGVPVDCIREIDPETMKQRFIGHISLRKRTFLAIKDPVERKRLEEENKSRKPGDPLSQWEIGYFLIPSVHGRGIMPLTLRTMLHQFWLPHMNVQKLTGGYFDHNSASKRVFEKNGFVFLQYVPEAIELQESKTGVKGKRAGMTIMVWEPTQ